MTGGSPVGRQIPPAKADGRRSDKSYEERLLRTRERNRHAQARLRQKQKEQHENLERYVQKLSADRDRAEDRLTHLRRNQNVLVQRILSAAHASLETHDAPASRPSSACHASVGKGNVASAVPDTTVGAFVATYTDVHTSCTPCPQPGQLLTRKSSNSRDIYNPPDLLPPPISSFHSCAGITFEDLVVASGSMPGVINFSQTGLLNLMQTAQATAAQQLGCREPHVCWFLQSQYEVAPGVALSWSSTLSSPECIASFVLHMMLSPLELTVLGVRSQPSGTFREQNEDGGSDAGADGSGKGPRSKSMRSTQYAAPGSNKHARAAAAPGMYNGEASCDHGRNGANGGLDSWWVDHAGAARGCFQHGSAQAGPVVDVLLPSSSSEACMSSALRLRCGVNEVCCGRAGVRHAMRSVEELLACYCATDAEAGWTFVRKLGSNAANFAAAYDASTSAAEDGDAAAERSTGHDASAGSFSTGGSAGAPRSVRGTPAEEFHRDVSVALLAVLCEVRDACFESFNRWQSIRWEAREAAPCTTRQWQRRLHIVATMRCAANTVATRDAYRVFSNMAFNSIRTNMAQYVAENAHVNFYRKLRLSAAQASRAATLWDAWVRQRGVLSRAFSSATCLLRSIIHTLPISTHHLSHISDLAAALPKCTAQHACHACGSGDASEEVDSMERQASCGTCGARVPAMATAWGLLGADPRSMVGAADALRQLWRMQEAETQLVAALGASMGMPGRLLTASQQITSAHAFMDFGGHPVDFLVLCQLAATKERREALQTWPEVLRKPLPMCT